MNGLGQRVAVGAQGEGDAHRSHPHRGAVGGALPAGAVRVGPGAHPLQSELGGGAQQVQGTAGAHVILPAQECSGELVGVDAAATFGEESGQDESLLGVIRDAARRH